jgi:penicillin-binding protein 2
VNDRSRLRLVILGALVLSLPITLLGRLWYMQALAGSQYAAELNHTATSVVRTVAPRGMIVDDTGQPLADNDSALVVSALSTQLPKANLGTIKAPKANPARVAEFERLSAILGVPADQLEAKATLCDYATYHQQAPEKNPGCWTGSPLQPIPLVSIDNTTPDGVKHATDVAVQVLEQQELFPGITAQVEDVRAYLSPDGAQPAQLVGHVGKITADDIANAKTPDDAKTLTAEAGAGGVVGQEGLEAEYNSYLEGTMGTKTISVDPAGKPLATLAQTAPTPGDELVTSIDAKVQKIAEQAIVDAVNHARTVPQLTGNHEIKTVHADAAAAVVIDVRTGHVIAAANYPTYNPGVWDGTGIDPKTYQQLLQDPGKPLFSQAIQGQYAPGSTFKVVTTAGAVSTPHYSLSGTYECPPVFTAGGRTFSNFEGETGQGNITFQRALVTSCDTFFYSIADTLWKADGGIHPIAHPADTLISEARAFGFGKPTNIDLPIDGSGSIETRQEKIDAYNKNKALWCSEAKTEPNPLYREYDVENCQDGYQYREGDALNFAIGQGTVTVSPLQLAAAYAAIGNGGTLYSPRIGKAIVAPDGTVVQTIDAPSTKLPVPPKVLAYEQDALSKITTDPAGTASAAFAGFPIGQYTVSGKTGTAEVQSLNPDGSQKDPTAWFASYGGPAGQPAQYAVVVMVSQGAQGGITAAPAVRQIYDGIWGLNGNPANPHDQFAAAGPALPNGMPPAALPSLFSGTGAAPSAPASPSAGTSAAAAAFGIPDAPSGHLAGATTVAAIEPDRRSRTPGPGWAS